MLQLDRQGVQDVKNLLYDLLGWVGAVRVWAKPALENRAAGELEEPALDTLALHLRVQLRQQAKPVHRWPSLACFHRSEDRAVVLINRMVHLDEKNSCLVLIGFFELGFDLVLLGLHRLVVVRVVNAVQKLCPALGVCQRRGRCLRATLFLSSDQLGLDGIVAGEHVVSC